MISAPQNAQLRGLLRELLRHQRKRATAAVSLMLLVAVLEGSGLMVLAPLLGFIGLKTGASADHGPLAALASVGLAPTLGGVLLGYLLLILLHSVAAWRRDVVTAQLQQGLVDQLRMDLYRHIGAAEWSFLARTHSAELGHALNTDLGRISMALNALLQISTTAVMALAYLAIAFSLSVPLSALTLALGGMLVLLLRRHHGRSHAGGYRLTEFTRRLHTETSEFLAGLRLIRSGNLEAAAERRYGRRLSELRAEMIAFAHRQAVTRGLLRVGGAAALALITYLSLKQLHIDPATVLVLIFIFSRLLPFLSTLQQAHERLLYNLPAYASFDGMRARCAAAVEPVPAMAAPTPFARSLRLEGIAYRPPQATADILSGVSLEIPWRGTVALIGPSGAGKSTLADLVGGLLAPSAGRILVDGAELRDRRAWRRCVAYVPQDGFLLNASVRDNLCWTNPEASEAELREALTQAAAEFVHDLPQGMETVLGERGLRLSGGERQRLAIARALLRRPQLLILDEATSSLDRDNERRIQESLVRLHGRLTMLVIAHRLETVRDADRIYAVERGCVREAGRFEELARGSDERASHD